MNTPLAESILKNSQVMMGSVFGWDRRTPEDETLMQKIATRAGKQATQEQMADAIAAETGEPAAVVQIRHRVWVRGSHPDDDGFDAYGEILYQANPQ